MTFNVRALRMIIAGAGLAIALTIVGSDGVAQTAPTPAETADYTGLHAAAWAGDLDATLALLVAGADPGLRDGRGRTPLHVAAFASHDEVVRALIDAGADPDALEGGLYDIVTIAAVADDRMIGDTGLVGRDGERLDHR